MLTGRSGNAGQAVPGGPVGEAERAGRAGSGSGLSDADVLQASIREPGRFGEIFDRYADDILRYTSARLGAGLAEDVTAETFLAAFGGRGRYDFSRSNARPWLYGIAIRQIGKHRRAERRYRKALGRVQAETVTADFGDRAADRVTAQQLRPRLSAVLSGLPRQDRELLLLVAWSDLSYAESAHALGMSVSAVKSRLHRVRARTRHALADALPAHLSEETLPAHLSEESGIPQQMNQETGHG